VPENFAVLNLQFLTQLSNENNVFIETFKKKPQGSIGDLCG